MTNHILRENDFIVMKEIRKIYMCCKIASSHIGDNKLSIKKYKEIYLFEVIIFKL